MNLKITDIMVEAVISAKADDTIEHVRELMERNRIHAVPIAGEDGAAIGIVTSADLVAGVKAGTHVGEIMTNRVYTVPAYNDVHVAARVMRNHQIHHVVVTHEKEIIGIVSSFDLLKLVEEHRFVMKEPPGRAKKTSGKRM
jgi:CBS domain-containing protein